MPSDANSGQKEFWTGRSGPKWVTHQNDLDAIMRSVQALLIDAAAARPGERVMDIGCGTGDTTFAFARIVGPAGQVQGVDVSATMLAHARSRQKGSGLGNVEFLLADAQDHAFAPAAFDRIVSRFGTMFFANPEAAFRNMATTLKPGGRMHFACWAGQEHNPFFTMPQRVAEGRMGPVEPVEPVSPDAPGPMAFRDIGRVTGMLRAAGLAAAEGAMHRIDLHHPGTPEEVAALLVSVGSAAWVIVEKGGTAEDAAAIRDLLGDALRPYAGPDGIRIPAAINLFGAMRA